MITENVINLVKEFGLFNSLKSLISTKDINAEKRHPLTLLELRRLELENHCSHYYKEYRDADYSGDEEYTLEKYAKYMNELADVLDLIHNLKDKVEHGD